MNEFDFPTIHLEVDKASTAALLKMLEAQDQEHIDRVFDGLEGIRLEHADGRSVELIPAPTLEMSKRDAVLVATDAPSWQSRNFDEEWKALCKAIGIDPTRTVADARLELFANISKRELICYGLDRAKALIKTRYIEAFRDALEQINNA